MTNHITKLQNLLSTLEDKGDPSPSRLARLQIAATLALAQEVRAIGNVMAWGARDDIQVEAGEAARVMEMEIGQAVKPFIEPIELHDCTRSVAPADRGWDVCGPCTDSEFCEDNVPF